MNYFRSKSIDHTSADFFKKESSSMVIGVAGPMTLSMLNLVDDPSKLPVGYSFPLISLIMKAYMKRGHRVVGFTTSVGIAKPRVYEQGNLVVCVIPRRDTTSARDLFLEERAYLVEAMQTYKVDVMHAHWTYEFAWSSISADVPTLVTMHDHAWTIFKQSKDAYRFMRWLMNQYVFYKAEHISCVSNYLFDFLSTKNKQKTRVIPLFFPAYLNELKPTLEKNSTIVSVCNGFSYRKNIETALRAFAILYKKYPAWKYDVIGTDMEMGGRTYQFAQKHGLLGGVNFLGPLSFDQTVKNIRSSSVFLHPSREESFGAAVLEAMFLGTPVIGGKSSGYVPYLLSEGRGFLCDINSPESIVATLEEVFNAKKIHEIIHNAHAYVITHHSEETIISQYESYLNEIYNKHKKIR